MGVSQSLSRVFLKQVNNEKVTESWNLSIRIIYRPGNLSEIVTNLSRIFICIEQLQVRMKLLHYIVGHKVVTCIGQELLFLQIDLFLDLGQKNNAVK